MSISTAALLCARAAVRRMSTARGGAGGSIVMLSSIASRYRRRRRIRFLRRRQRRHRRADHRARARGGEGGHPRQRHPPGADRHRNPRAGAAGAYHAAYADGPAGRSPTKSPRRSCSCSRMPRPISPARFSTCPVGDSRPCLRRLAAYDRGRNLQNNPTIQVFSGSETWSRQCAFTNRAVPRR